MSDFWEIDFLDVETKKSGDAITLRYSVSGRTYIHVVDGGYVENGEMIINHINSFYNHPSKIDHVVSTHPDQDHTGGLRRVVEEMEVGELWMNRPWLYVNEIIHRFSRFTNPDNLARSLKAAYPNTAALEDIALRRNIPIREAFQGTNIGAFTVMAPTRARYLDKIVESEKTGQVAKVLDDGTGSSHRISQILADAIAKTVSYIRSGWGSENFPIDGTSAENEMSIVQCATLCDRRILLTADAGREGLKEVAGYAPYIGISLPGIDYFQVPHHGSRRNVSTDLLNEILGPKLPQSSAGRFVAVISSAKADKDHPRKAVVRAMHHRGANIITTEGGKVAIGHNYPARAGWGPAPTLPYPEEQED